MSATPITPAEILERAKAMHEQVRAWRREIHRHPELGFQEHRTSGLVNATLVDLGIQTDTEVAKTGVVGHIKGGRGPLVGLRADMDALPIQEVNGSDFDSTNAGVMHACGHDSHTAMLLGAATILKGFAEEGRLPGNVRLFFQPSEENQDEEGKSGGRRMVEEGVTQGVDALFGIHVGPGLPVGHLSSRSGPLLAAADRFRVEVIGSGGHGAAPHQTNDPILLASYVISAIHHVIGRRINPLDAGVITIGRIQGGTADNVIPGSVTLSGTIRSMTQTVRDQLHDELRRACAIVEGLGGRFELEIFPGYPPTVCAPEAVETMMAATKAILGEEKVHTAEPIMAAEDFSYMLQQAPGCMIQLGVHNPAWELPVYPVHRADFRMDEDALPVGVAALVASAVEWMQIHVA
ncbi:MAG TPA: M20 family metallopeptidase [Caldilineaceae bacterium]|nr:M20 family metallopeptidase [Caldilineaceae bacterium]